MAGGRGAAAAQRAGGGAGGSPAAALPEVSSRLEGARAAGTDDPGHGWPRRALRREGTGPAPGKCRLSRTNRSLARSWAGSCALPRHSARRALQGHPCHPLQSWRPRARSGFLSKTCAGRDSGSHGIRAAVWGGGAERRADTGDVTLRLQGRRRGGEWQQVDAAPHADELTPQTPTPVPPRKERGCGSRWPAAQVGRRWHKAPQRSCVLTLS